MPTALARYRPEALQIWVDQVLQSNGVPPEEAAQIAALIVRTDARGFVTHGVSRMPTYAAKLQSGEYNPRPAMQVERSSGLLRISADGAMGQWAGLCAIRECIEAARTEPAVMCFVRDLGHLGAVGMLPLLAAEQGCFGLAIQRTPPVLALPGSKGPLIGHSPIAYAVPVPGEAPVVFDMACSVAARGHILLAAQRGEPIPEGWALDANGQPTTDPVAATEGMLLPTGGYKGLGLGILGEILAGSLACSLDDRDTMRDAVRGSGASGGGSAFFWVINPARVNGRSSFDALVGDWVEHYLHHAGEAARLPGRRAAAAEQSVLRDGLSIDEPIAARLRALGERLDIAWPRAMA